MSENTVDPGDRRYQYEPIRCPRCGRAPRRRERFLYPTSGRRESLVVIWYECRRWYLIRPCRRGPEATNTKDWVDLADRRAVRAWNEATP